MSFSCVFTCKWTGAWRAIICTSMLPAGGASSSSAMRGKVESLIACLHPSTVLQAQAAEELANAALALSHYQAATDADEVDLDLIESLLAYICEVRFAVALLLLAVLQAVFCPCLRDKSAGLHLRGVPG